MRKEDGREHEAYLELWKLIEKQDELITAMFDDFRRKTAFFKLALRHRYGLASGNELALFTEETQAIIKAISQNAWKSWITGKSSQIGATQKEV